MNSWTNQRGHLSLKNIYILALILFCLALYGPTPFKRDLHGTDELRYAEVVREMRVDKDWLVPRFGGEYYSEKPPVYFWVLILSQSLLGKSTFSMVLPSIISGILGILLIYFFGRRILKERYAFLAGLILATSGLYFGLAVFLRMDMLLTILASAASIVFFEGYRQEDVKIKNRCYYFFYILMAMAILIKGPTGFLMPFITAVVFLLSTGHWSEFKKIKLLQGLGILLGVIGLWAVAIILSGNKDYAYQLFVVQTMGRAVKSFSHPEPFYYYLKVFPGIFMPWTVFLISIFAFYLKNLKSLNDVDKYMLSWLIAPLVLMSLFSGKLAIYLLPIFPAAALLVARLFELVGEEEAKPSYVVVPTVLTLLLLLVLIFVLPKHAQGFPLRALLRPAVIPYVALGISAVYALLKRRFHWVPMTMAGMFLVFMAVFTWNVLPKVSAGYTKKPIALEIKRLRQNGEHHIIAYRYYQPESMGYYNGILIKEVANDKLAGYLSRHKDALILIEEKHLKELEQYKVEQIYKSNKDVLVKLKP